MSELSAEDSDEWLTLHEAMSRYALSQGTLWGLVRARSVEWRKGEDDLLLFNRRSLKKYVERERRSKRRVRVA